MEIIKKDVRKEALEKTAIGANEKNLVRTLLKVCENNTFLRAAGTNLEFLTLGGIEHASITFL